MITVFIEESGQYEVSETLCGMWELFRLNETTGKRAVVASRGEMTIFCDGNYVSMEIQ